jgi:hypothetical protein
MTSLVPYDNKNDGDTEKSSVASTTAITAAVVGGAVVGGAIAVTPVGGLLLEVEQLLVVV